MIVANPHGNGLVRYDCMVRYDDMEGKRFRHTAQFRTVPPGSRTRILHLRPARWARPVNPADVLISGEGPA